MVDINLQTPISINITHNSYVANYTWLARYQYHYESVHNTVVSYIAAYHVCIILCKNTFSVKKGAAK